MTEPTNVEAVTIPVDAITTDLNVRRKADKDLVASIKAHGLLQPIVVARAGEGYTLVAGSRRLAAVRVLGWKGIPAVIHGAAGDGDLMAASLAENADRRDLTPIEEAEAIAAMREKGYALEDVAAHFARSDRWLNDRLALLELPKAVRDKLHAGEWPIGYGLLVLRGATPAVQQKIIALLEKGMPADSILRDLRDERDKLGGAKLPPALASSAVCRACPKRGANKPSLFGVLDDFDKREAKDEANVCYDQACREAKLAAEIEKLAAAGMTVYSFADARKHPKKYGLNYPPSRITDVWRDVKNLKARATYKADFKACAKCEKHAVVAETGEMVCADDKCYHRKAYGRDSVGWLRWNSTARVVSGAADKTSGKKAVKADPFNQAQRDRVRLHEATWAHREALKALAAKNARAALVADRVILVAAYVGVSTYDEQRRDGFAGHHGDEKILHTVLTDKKAAAKARDLVLARALNTGLPNTARLITAAAALGLNRAKGYDLTAPFIQEAGFTKKGMAAIAKEGGVKLDLAVKAADVRKALAKSWRKGKLPKVVQEVWDKALKAAGVK